jgi:hypothetical protein
MFSIQIFMHAYYRGLKKFHVRLLGTRFKARNYISEPGPQELSRTM